MINDDHTQDSLQNEGGQDEPLYLVAPLDYDDMNARVAAAQLLAALAVRADTNEEPALPGGFTLPGQAIVITGVECALLNSPQGEGMTQLDPDGVLTLLWYGTSSNIDRAMATVADRIQEQQHPEDPLDTQHLLAKWRNTDTNLALLALFTTGQHVADGINAQLANGLDIRLIHDDREPATVVKAGEQISILGLDTDNEAGVFDLLLSCAANPEDRIELMEIMEQLHPGVLGIMLDDNAKQDWRIRMS